MKALTLACLFIAGLIAFVSCKDDAQTPSAPLAPRIASVQQGVSPGEVCIITGDHFGEDPNVVAVFFDHTPAEIMIVQNLAIRVYVPYAVDYAGMDVRVSVSGRS